MIFSKEKWNGTDGLKMFVNASKAFSFETLEGPLRMVWLTFIVPLLGEDLAEVIVGIFNKDKEARSYQEQMVLMHAQNALANITLWYCFDEINTRLTDQGHQRQENEKQVVDQLCGFRGMELRVNIAPDAAQIQQGHAERADEGKDKNPGSHGSAALPPCGKNQENNKEQAGNNFRQTGQCVHGCLLTVTNY